MKLIPNKLNICGFTCDVKLVDSLEDDTKILGMAIPYKNEILISKMFGGRKRKADRLCETLIHESFHLINSILDISMSHERLEKLSIGLHQVLVDNNINLKYGDKIPKKIKIGGFSYTVKYPYKFDLIDTQYYQLDDTDSHILKLSNRHDGEIINFDFIKRNFLILIIAAINFIYCSLESDDYDDFKNYYLRTFSHGIYQFLIENDIEKIVKLAAKVNDV